MAENEAWDGQTTLIATDHGNVWRNLSGTKLCINPWLGGCDRSVRVVFLDKPDQPTMMFVPFDNPGYRSGMKPSDADKALWLSIAGETNRDKRREFRIKYRVTT